jgi:hypothetical protein
VGDSSVFALGCGSDASGASLGALEEGVGMGMGSCAMDGMDKDDGGLKVLGYDAPWSIVSRFMPSGPPSFSWTMSTN